MRRKYRLLAGASVHHCTWLCRNVSRQAFCRVLQAWRGLHDRRLTSYRLPQPQKGPNKPKMAKILKFGASWGWGGLYDVGLLVHLLMLWDRLINPPARITWQKCRALQIPARIVCCSSVTRPSVASFLCRDSWTKIRCILLCPSIANLIVNYVGHRGDEVYASYDDTDPSVFAFVLRQEIPEVRIK